MLYNIFIKRPKSFELLRKKLSDFIVEEGTKLVQDEQLKIDQFVVQLIQLRETIFEVFTKSMNKDPQIDMTIKFAFEKIVNTDQKTAKALVFYLDELFKTEFKTLEESEINEKLDKVIQIFRYLLDKDVFEGYYKNAFAKRLLDVSAINEDVEKVLLLKLKEECGFAFTQRLEVMFKDIKMSEELTKEFQGSLVYNTIHPLEKMTVKVLTTGHWPNEQREAQQLMSNLPREITTAMNTFTQYYFSKFSNGRQLY